MGKILLSLAGMNYTITRWSDSSGPSREQIKSAFDAENLPASIWSNGPNDRYSAHTHPYHKVLYCLAGSIVFHINGDNAELKAGDRLDLPPGISHAASVGPEGVTCMEAAKD